MPSVNEPKRPVGRPALVQQPLIDWCSEVGDWMISYLKKNKRLATGNTINSFEVTVKNKPTRVSLQAADSVKWALAGRNKGTAPPIIVIYDWVVAKGFARGSDEITLNSIAWAIRTKIAKEGTNQPRLKQQQIRFAIEQKGKKYLEQIGVNLAQETADAMVKSFAKDPNKK
tara:strand:+ start:2697 stop:3209 length:513 start_codon:yes stop_codon:yes gene_type:complete